MGKFFKYAKEAKKVVSKKVTPIVKPTLSKPTLNVVSADIRNYKPSSDTIRPPKIVLPKVKSKSNNDIISLPKPKPGSIAAHTLNVVTNQRLDFRKNNNRFTVGKLRKPDVWGNTLYGLSFQKKF